MSLARTKVTAGTLGDSAGKIHILDRGTGSGRDLKWFYENVREDAVVLGIDNSEGFIDLLEQRVKEGDLPEGCFAKMDMTDMQIQDASYDVIRDNTSLLHLPDLGTDIFRLSADRAVAEAYRVLKPGGVYFVMVKAGEGFQAIDSGEGLGVRYFQFYTSSPFRALLERNGFMVPKVETWIDHRPSGDVEMLFIYAEKPLEFTAVSKGQRVLESGL